MEGFMLRFRLFAQVATSFALLGIACCAFAQQTAPAPAAAPAKPAFARPVRPPLFFSETWKQPSTAPAPADHGAWPATPDDVSNANLKLQFYGAGTKDLLLSGTSASDTNPLNLW